MDDGENGALLAMALNEGDMTVVAETRPDVSPLAEGVGGRVAAADAAGETVARVDSEELLTALVE